MNDLPKTSPSLIEANKFKTFNESKTSKNTIIERNNDFQEIDKLETLKVSDIRSKFESHTIQWEQPNQPKNKFIRKRSLSKKEKRLPNQKKPGRSNRGKMKVNTIDYTISSNCSPNVHKHLAKEILTTAGKESESRNSDNIYATRRPKISKPTKTITMNIYDDLDKKQSRNNPLRKSKETSSMRGSAVSKKTPQNDTDSIKWGGLSTTNPNTLSNSGKAAKVQSSNKTDGKNQSDKAKIRKRTLKDSKSQKCFEKNPISHGKRYNRLKEIKKNLDKHQSIINEISKNRNVDQKAKQGRIKRSTSRTSRRNTLLNNMPNRKNPVQNKVMTRSRSKTDIDNSKHQNTLQSRKKEIIKTNIYELNHKNVEKLSRNNSKENKDMKTKSFLKPTFSSSASTYKTHYKKSKDSYPTYINSRIVAGKGKNDKAGDSKKPTRNQKFTYIPKNYGSSTRNCNLQSRTNKNYYGLARYGSVSYNSSTSSVREPLGSKRGSSKQDTGHSKQSLNKHTYKTFLKDRKSLAEHKHKFHQNSHSTLPDYGKKLRNSKERSSKGVVSSFTGIETITFNLSSKVKMLQTNNPS